MKLRSLLVVGTFLCVLALGSCGKQGAVKWEDPVVAQAVGDSLGIPYQEIGPEDLEKIEQIVFVGNRCYLDEEVRVARRVLPEGGYGYLPGWASRSELGNSPGALRSLADFAHFPNLRELELYQMSFDRLEGVEGLQKCEKLQKLTLAANANLENLEGPSSLGQLTALAVFSVPILDFSGLSKMKSLTFLDLEDVPVESLDFLTELVGLKTFYADQVPEVDADVLKELPGLEQYYLETVSGTVVTNLEP